MRNRATLILALACASVLCWGLQAAEPKPPQTIDLAICLDTSNSMDGLIGSAKEKLWAIVSELATAKPHPKLRVALYQYGNDGLKNNNNGWVQQVCEFTDDLDKVNEKLFSLSTNGGTEYVARVVRDATNDLKWSTEKNAVKMIFVAGNEPATQDSELKLQDICKAAVTKGIVVNTIFCGPEDEGRRSGWSDAAAWADGRYAAIDQNKGTVVVQTKFDADLAKLSGELNKTYVAYGAQGKEGEANQKAQDSNASKLSAPAAAQRAAAKSSVLYDNARWDLVDASKKKDFDLNKIDTKDLPKEMQDMTPQQRKEHLDKMIAQRAELQKKIADLNTKRDADVKKQMSEKGLDEKSSFDAVLRKAVREQASKQGFTFEDAPTTKPAK